LLLIVGPTVLGRPLLKAESVITAILFMRSGSLTVKYLARNLLALYNE
jgi:hypothetical protein